MTKVVTAPSTSLDGLIAGADDSPEQRLGSTATDSSAGSATVIRPAGYYLSFKMSAVSAAFFDEGVGRLSAVIAGRRTYDISKAWGDPRPAGAGSGAHLPWRRLRWRPPSRRGDGRSQRRGVAPIVVGDSYCAAIDACHDVFDVRRGQIWTPCTTQRQFASVQQSRPRYGQQPETRCTYPRPISKMPCATQTRESPGRGQAAAPLDVPARLQTRQVAISSASERRDGVDDGVDRAAQRGHGANGAT
jgi:hypothetical protein